MSTESINLVSREDTARALGICTRHLFRLTATGELPAVRIGRRVLYDAATIRAFIERKKGVRHGS